MSLNDILTSALSGLGAAQAGMRTVSNNIANVNTPGYARERVAQQPGTSGGATSGVVFGEAERVADSYLEGAVNTRANDAGRSTITADYLDRLQSLLGAPGAEAALPSRLDAIGKAATSLTGLNTPGGQLASVFVGAVSDTIDSLQQLDSDVRSLRTDADSETHDTVQRINTLLSQIHDLNDTVAKLQGTGRSTAGAADQRTIAIEELSGLIGIVARPQADGRTMIETSAGAQLLDRNLRQLDYPDSGAGSGQSIYPAIQIRLVKRDGTMGDATGETINTPTVGGKLGGLIDIRDTQIPAFRDKLSLIFNGLAQALNGVTNANTSVPAPNALIGRATPLTASDRLGFTGAATFAVTQSDGTLLASTSVDFSSLATVQDAINAINSGLGSAGTATYADGKLTITASDAGNGVVVAQDGANPSARGGVGFSHYFGLNDLIQSDATPLVPSGFIGTDAHGFAADDAVDFALRDGSGKLVAQYQLQAGSAGTTFDDLNATLQSSVLGQYGTFTMSPVGRIEFTPTAAATGATLSIIGDSTSRAGTGVTFTAISGLAGTDGGLRTADISRTLAADPTKLPIAHLQDVAIGEKALGASDRTGSAALVDALSDTSDLGRAGAGSITRYASSFLGDAGTAASRAKDRETESVSRRDEAIARRDNYSGVSLDEELSQLVILQNSYSAAARIMSTASDMYDTLIGMVR